MCARVLMHIIFQTLEGLSHINFQASTPTKAAAASGGGAVAGAHGLPGDVPQQVGDHPTGAADSELGTTLGLELRLELLRVSDAREEVHLRRNVRHI